MFALFALIVISLGFGYVFWDSRSKAKSATLPSGLVVQYGLPPQTAALNVNSEDDSFELKGVGRKGFYGGIQDTKLESFTEVSPGVVELQLQRSLTGGKENHFRILLAYGSNEGNWRLNNTDISHLVKGGKYKVYIFGTEVETQDNQVVTQNYRQVFQKLRILTPEQKRQVQDYFKNGTMSSIWKTDLTGVVDLRDIIAVLKIEKI